MLFRLSKKSAQEASGRGGVRFGFRRESFPFREVPRRDPAEKGSAAKPVQFLRKGHDFRRTNRVADRCGPPSAGRQGFDANFTTFGVGIYENDTAGFGKLRGGFRCKLLEAPNSNLRHRAEQFQHAVPNTVIPAERISDGNKKSLH